ncbi:restriction endonuclease [Rhodopila globiformis]|uniref:restriction endonuclease n=1 Tax=Rhodopila globiformis TaxID=1071 RepID=UPI001304DBCA
MAFQCKRYSSPVSPSYIRDFRGAMQGRADRGIFLTTSTFSVEARREAGRERASRVELVDIDALIELLKELQIGVITQTIYVVDQTFFVEYRDTSKT